MLCVDCSPCGHRPQNCHDGSLPVGGQMAAVPRDESSRDETMKVWHPYKGIGQGLTLNRLGLSEGTHLPADTL